MYELGALRALEEALDGIDFNRVDVAVGVSAGSFIAACLANGLTTSQMCRAIVKPVPGEHPFSREVFFTPAFAEFLRSGAAVPRLLVQALAAYLDDPEDQTLVDSLGRVGRALPLGLFDNEPIRAFLERIFSLDGRTDDFRRLRSKLVVVAADLCSGRAVRFGADGFGHVPISQAVQASTALPGFYPPVEIDGHHYVDGVLLKTLHASVALDHGAKLVICVNPLVPADMSTRGHKAGAACGPLLDRGLPTLLSQTFRTLVHSRLTVGFAAYKSRYPGSDAVLFEPQRDEYDMFFASIFSFRTRKAVAEHAYASTRRALVRRRAELEPVFARHGIRFRDDVLADADRELWDSVGLPMRHRTVAARLDRALSRLEQILA